MTNKIVSCTISLESGFTHILFNLAAQGYHYIKIEYAGSGDSGCIDDIYLVPQGKITIEDGVVNDSYDYNTIIPDDELKEIIEEKAYKYVLDDADDWYNNDGGGGKLYISTLDGSFYCNHYVNIITTEDSVITGKFGDN